MLQHSCPSCTPPIWPCASVAAAASTRPRLQPGKLRLSLRFTLLWFRTDMVDTKMTKSAGEHWTCSVLSSLGWGAALTRDGLERTDILAVWTGKDRVVIEVQVKSASHNAKQNWRVGTKAQLPSVSEREWFVMVALAAQAGDAPRSYVIPRDHLAAAAYIVHQDWLTDPSIAPGVRNTGLEQARLHADYLAAYENRWDLLIMPTPAVPVLLAPPLRTLALSQRVGLPPDHPWNKNLPIW